MNRYGNSELFAHALQVRDDLELEGIVQGGERFVHQKQAGVGQDRPTQRDPLFFSAGKIINPSLQEVFQFQHADQALQGDGSILFRTTFETVEQI